MRSLSPFTPGVCHEPRTILMRIDSMDAYNWRKKPILIYCCLAIFLAIMAAIMLDGFIRLGIYLIGLAIKYWIWIACSLVGLFLIKRIFFKRRVYASPPR